MPRPHTIETEIEIDATPNRVWSVLMDTAGWTAWNPSFPHVGGPFVTGEEVEIHLQLRPGDPVVASPTVVTCDHDRHILIWRGVLGGSPRVFCGHHSFELEPVEGSARTRVVHDEDMRGLALPLVRMTGQVRATRNAFLAMNDALKARCEAPH